MKEKICQWCKLRKANSKEHLVVHKRLKEIKKNQNKKDINDNIRKTFTGITCTECNKLLGDAYECKGDIPLAYVTMWKLLAGNINEVFPENAPYFLKNTNKESIGKYADIMKTVIEQPMGRLPYNTFEFFVDFQNAGVENDAHHLTTPIHQKVISAETGEPIEGVSVYISGNAKDDKGYATKTNKDGFARLNIMTQVEKLSVIYDRFLIVNADSDESFLKDSDWIVYFSFRGQYGRILTILPLVGSINTPWKNAKIYIKHKDFLSFLQEHFSRYGIIKISPIF